MGDRKPKKNSSGNADAHKAKKAKDQSARPILSRTDEKGKGKKK